MKAMFSQLGPIAWARAFDALREAKGVKDGHGGDRGNQHTGGKPAETTFAKLAAEQGVSEDTARRRLKLARDLEPYPETAEKVDKGRATAVQRLLRGYEVGSCAAGVSF